MTSAQMDKSRKRALKRVSVKHAPGATGSGVRGAQDVTAQGEREEPLSLAQSRRKRAMRIAKRAAMEAARANSVGLASIEAEQNGQLGESQASAESILLGEVAARAGQGAKSAGRFAARRAKANAIAVARRRREGAIDRKSPPPAQRKMAKGARAQRRTAKSWSLKTLGMGVETVAVEKPRPLARFMGGALPIPFAGRAPRGPRMGWIAGGIAASIVPLLIAAVVTMGIPIAAAAAMAIFGGQSRTSTGNLTGNEQVIASHLLAADIDQMHVAAIMGNMYKESGYSPTALNASSGAFGVCQWLGGRKAKLIELCNERGVDATDLPTQIEFFVREYKMEGAAGWNSTADRDAFMAITGDESLNDAVAFFARRFERCGEGEMDLPTRCNEAKRVRDAMRTGVGGVEYAASSETAQRIADASSKVPSPGMGLCAMWVSQVYSLAGCGYPGGNACDMYYAWCKSSERSELKVGMMVAVPTNGLNEMGRKYGHVGIYIGDGKVRHNIGQVVTDDLDEWISCYGTEAEVRWGYPSGVQE